MTIDEHIRRQEAGELPEGYPVRVTKEIDDGWTTSAPPVKFIDIQIFEEPFCRIPDGLIDWDELLYYAELVGSDGSEGTYDNAINKYRKERGEEPL